MIKKKEKTCANIVPATKRYINVKIDKNDGSFILTTETWFEKGVVILTTVKIELQQQWQGQSQFIQIPQKSCTLHSTT
jgi:hypothetical protein